MFTRVIHSTMGFTQRLGKRAKLRAGLSQFHAEFLHKELASEKCYVPAPYEWDAGADWLLGWIRNNCSSTCRHDVIAYSYGGGVWYPQFQEGMKRIKRKIHTVNLIDPVNRLARMNPWRWFGYKIPVHDVHHLNVFFQKNNHPRSPGVDAYNCETEFVAVPSARHEDMDNHDMVWTKILESLRG